jgi:hypothetical protein
MYYDTSFKVRYYDIQKELLDKIKSRLPENADVGYNAKDVIDICGKLYRDELSSVFGADNIMDEKLPQGFKFLENVLSTHPVINGILNEMTEICIDDIVAEQGEIENRHEKEKEIKEIVTTALFSQHLFHITHLCVCQYLETDTIDEDLLERLKKNSIDAFRKKTTS